jgi:hypothetical protein
VRQLTKAGCRKVYQKTASWARSDCAQLRKVIEQLDAGDVLMVVEGPRWKRWFRRSVIALARTGRHGSAERRRPGLPNCEMMGINGAGMWKSGKVSWLTSLPVAAAVFLCAVGHASDLPTLSSTGLYRTVAHNCHPVDLITWNHPTKDVLIKYQIPLFALELCNSDRYPIFHVNFKYDPMALTDSFFVPFYKAIFSANGRNPMAFVETTSGNVIVVLSNDHGNPRASYEQFRS